MEMKSQYLLIIDKEQHCESPQPVNGNMRLDWVQKMPEIIFQKFHFRLLKNWANYCGEKWKRHVSLSLTFFTI